MSSAPRRGRKHPFLLGLRETLGGRGGRTKLEMPVYRLRWGFKGGSPVPFQYLLEEGAWGAGMGVLSATSRASDHCNSLSPSEKH